MKQDMLLASLARRAPLESVPEDGAALDRLDFKGGAALATLRLKDGAAFEASVLSAERIHCFMRGNFIRVRFGDGTAARFPLE